MQTGGGYGSRAPPTRYRHSARLFPLLKASGLRPAQRGRPFRNTACSSTCLNELYPSPPQDTRKFKCEGSTSLNIRTPSRLVFLPAVARAQGQHRGLHRRRGPDRLAVRGRPGRRRDRGTGTGVRHRVSVERGQQLGSHRSWGGGAFVSALVVFVTIYTALTSCPMKRRSSSRCGHENVKVKVSNRPVRPRQRLSLCHS